MIRVGKKGNYKAWSNNDSYILNIKDDGNGINAITQEENKKVAKFNRLEVYA